jgi:hypothetical protein
MPFSFAHFVSPHNRPRQTGVPELGTNERNRVIVSVGTSADDDEGRAATTDGRAKPLPVRNDIARHREEVAVLRNHRLKKGGNEPFYLASRDDIWPLFERNGSRVVGQWKVIETKTPAPSELEDIYRLARYASIEHWQATRFQTTLVGNGPALDKELEGRRVRGKIEKDSKGVYFLQGKLSLGGPYFMPGLQEQYKLVEIGKRPNATDPTIPVRVGVAQPGDEIVEIRYQRIQKGGYQRFVTLTEENIWPWEEKLGARPIGQWQVIYPTGFGSSEQSRGLKFITTENSSYDEVVTITRYAGKAHYEAMGQDQALYLGGNGPDWLAWSAALERQKALTFLTEIEIAQGFLYQSPPAYLPALAERYRLAE